MTRLLVVVLKLALSAGLVWYAFSKIDFSSAWTTLISLPLAALLAAIGLLAVQLVLGAYRLRQLLGHLDHNPRLISLLDIVWIGAFFSQTFVSFVGGDAMRIWRLMRRSGVSAAVATQGVLLDRLAGFAGVVCVLLITIPFLVPMLESFEMKLGLLLIAGGVLAFIFCVFILRRLPERLRQTRGIEVPLRFASLGLQIARSGRSGVTVLLLSVVIQLANVLILFILARGLSIGITFGLCLLFMPTVLFLSMLPISIAGWGVREGAMVASLSVLGVPAHQSLALSICFGLCLILISLPGGVIWFISRSKVASAEEPSQLPT
jgi:uncharacterized membrane protein YbhN (UPF0104 family)